MLSLQIMKRQLLPRGGVASPLTIFEMCMQLPLNNWLLSKKLWRPHDDLHRGLFYNKSL